MSEKNNCNYSEVNDMARRKKRRKDKPDIKSKRKELAVGRRKKV